MAKFSEWIKNRGEEEEKKSSSPYSKNDYARYRAEKSIGLDTFESDLANMNTTLSGIVGGWQTQETMENTRSAVESMYKRTTDYQNYISKYQPDAKTNIGDISSYYKNALDSWDSLSEAYGYYKDADSYSKAMTKAKFENDNDFKFLSYDKVQEKMKQYSPDSDEYKYLSEYTGYKDLKDFDKALEGATGDYASELNIAKNKHELDNKFDLYSDIMKNPDYAEKSQYKSTQNQKKFLGMEFTDYGDEVYEYINNVNDARTNLIAKYKEGNGATELEQHGYEYMRPHEIGVFNYLYAQDKEQAYKYLEDIEISLNKRSYENSTGQWKEIAGKHDNLAWDALVSLPTLIYQPAGGIGNILASAGEALTGKEYNPYAPLRTPSNASADIRQYVGENMDERYDAVEILGAEAPSLLYQNAMSTLDSLIGVRMFGKGHSVLMASNAFQQTAKQMTEAGENPETALLLGGVSGMAELAFEYAGIDKLFGIKNSDSLKRTIVSALKQAGVEGLEEMGTEFVNILSDTIIRGDHSELMTTIQDLRDRGFSKREINTEVAKKVASQIGLAGLSGMMSGVVMGGTFAGNQYHNLSETGKQIAGNETAGDLMDFAGQFTDKESETYKLYTEYANKGFNADNITPARLGNLYNAVEGDVRSEYKSARANDIMRSVANKENEFGDSKNSGLIASAIQKKTDGQRLSSEERSALKSDTAQAILQDGVRVKASDEFDNALANMKRTESIITPKTEAEKARLQELKKLKTGEKTVNAEGNEVTIEGVKTENGATTIQTSQGEVLASEMTFSSSDAEIVSYAQNMTAEKADLFVKMYDGKMNVDDYATSFDLAYSYGENKMDLSNALRNKGVLTEAQALKAYEAGNVGRAIAKQKAVDEINAKYSGKTFIEGKFDDSIIDYEGHAEGKVAWADLTERQRKALNLLRAIAKVTGANISLIKSEVIDQKTGKRKGENGRYEASTNTMYIDVFAGIDAGVLADAIVPTFSHEITHWMKAKAPAMYQKMQDYLLETLTLSGKKTLNQLIAEEKYRMKQAHPDQKVTDEDAIDELVARGAEDMLANSEKIRELLGNMTESEQKTFIAKVKEVFQNIIDWVNDLLGQYNSKSDEAKLLRQYEHRMKELSKMWDEALTEAIQTNQSMQAEGITDSAFGMIKSEMQYNLRAVETHKTNLEKQYNAEDADISLGTLMERYDKIIDIWDRLGGEITSEFLNEWNNMVGKDRTFTIFKAQAGYDYNVEFSSMCKKGVPLFEAIDHIVKKEVMKELKTDTIGKAEKEILYEILKKHHFEIPCAICYVEQARQREGNLINAFIDGRVEKDKNGKVTYRKVGWNEVLGNIEKEMKANGVDYKFPSVDRNISTENYTPADISMDERTQEAFFNALKKLANEEIKRNNKENNKNRALIKDTSIAELKKTAFKGKLPDNIAIYKTLYYEPSSRFTIDKDLLYSSTTTRNLSMAHREFYSLFNSQGGVGGYKTKQGTVVYWGDILNKKWKPSTLRNAGGVRNQSNSDFQMYTLLDQVQMYIDFSAKGYYLQAYTKVLSELKLLGLSNGKINASLIPKVVVYRNADGTVDIAKTMENAGLDENGNPIFDDIEGINHAEAFMLMEDAEYSKSICGVCIGYSDKHILKLLDDKRIQLIIGFHDKTDDADKRYAGARYAKNYNGINEATKKSDGKTVHFGFNQFVRKAEGKFKNGKTSIVYDGRTYTVNDIPKLATKLYLEYCDEKKYNPAYSQGGVDFSKHENYYKLLADFGLYNSEGNYAPHKKVTYNMPDQVPYLDANGNKAYMPTEDYIKEELKKELKVRDSISEALADKSEEGIIPQFVKEVNKLHEQPKVQNSDRDSDYLDAVNRGDMETAQKMVDEVANKAMADSKIKTPDGKLRVVYHGTNTGDFTVFNPDYIGMSSGDDGYFGMGFYFAYSEGEARYYGAKRVIPAYLNIKNPFNFDKELRTYNGKKTTGSYASDAVTLMNFADKFPNIAKDITIDIVRKGSEDIESISLSEFSKAFKDVINNKKFDYQESSNEWGELETVVIADEETVEYEVGGKKHSYKDYGFQKRFYGKPNELDVAYEYLSNSVYDHVYMINGTRIILDNNREFTATLKEMGYDGTIQSEAGDEAVAFDSKQIKSAEPVTYDDQGNVIPLSERFNTENADIRYSDREQTITSEDTSLNQTPATFTNYEFKSTDRILDWGGGKYDTAKKAMEATYQGIKFEVVDAFNRTKTHNDRILEEYTKEKANVLTINNVLNVINSEAVIESVVSESKQYLAEDGICYIAIYEGSKDGNSKETSAGWQNNQPASWYMQFVEKHYKYVRRQGSFIIASDSPIVGKTAKISTETKATLKQNTDSLKKENLNMKHSVYSDRDYTSVYELMGEKETLDEENRKLKADIEKLKATIGSEDVKIARFRSLADYLKKLAGSNYSREALGDSLKELYNYIQTTDDLKWYNVMAKAEEIANDMMQLNVPINYFREVMNDIRQDKVSLSEDQYAEAVKLYGSYGNLHKALFGSINLTKSGKPLEEQWKDWSKAFPTVFKADISAVDMVKELRDTVDALKNTSAVMGEYERQEAIRHMGMEIYNQFWNIASDSSEAVRKERVAHREMMAEMRKDYEERQAEKTLHPQGELALKYEKLLNDTIKRDRAEMKRIRELGNKRMEEYKERAERRATIQKITKNALTLNEWFVKNSKDKHIPEDMKGAVVQLISAIDFSSKQMLGIGGAEERRGQPTKKDVSLAKALSRLYEVADEMKDNQTEDEVFLDLDIPDSAVALLKQLSTKSLLLNQMTLEQLQALDVIVSTFKSAIIKANKNFVLAQNETRERTSNLLIHDADSLVEKKADNLATNFLEYANTTPYYMLKRLGRVGEQIFNALMDAQEQLVFLEEEIINYVKNTVDGKKIKQWSEEIHEIKILDGKRSTKDDPKYKTIKMTTAQIMSLYALEKRESAKLHLAGGGIRIANIKDGLNTIKDAEGSSLSNSELYSIIGRLTNEQKRVADALQKYMSETGAEWGNKVTMARWDIKQFGEENYFPMATVAQDRNLDDVGKKDNSIYRLLNMSFTKELTPKANNQLVIDNIFDVFSSHMTDMAKYTTHALPLLDTMKILGYSRKDFYVDEDGKKSVRHDTISVASSIRRAFGDNGYRYIINLLKDLNGVEVTPRDETLTKTMMANYKISAVGGNLRVALLQGSAYIKAGLVMNPKYLTKALATNGLEGIKKAMKHSGIALWKSKGHYDLNIGRSVASEIKQDENWMDKVREWSLKGAEWGDKITWGYLWNACELWAKENTPYSYNSAEFNKAVADKLREIIVKTQVVDSTLTRSQMMRGKSAMVQTLTAFMSESTMTYNMVSDAFFEWSLDARKEGHSYKSTFSKHGRKFATTASVYALTAFATALAGGFVDAVRDDDEDEEFDEKYLQHLLEALGDNLNLFANLPIAKDIVSIAQGYSPSRFDEQSFVNLFSGMRQWMKVVEGEGNVYKATYKTLQGMSQLSGLPVSNAMRDVVAMWNTTIGEMYPNLKIEQ